MGLGAGIDVPENVAWIGVRSPGRPARKDLLYPLSAACLGCTDHKLFYTNCGCSKLLIVLF